MARLEEIAVGARVRGIVHDAIVEIVESRQMGDDALSIVFREPNHETKTRILFRSQESQLEIVSDAERARPFTADGKQFRLVSEAYRIRLAHLFDPLLAVHTSLVQPLPHQITAVYDEMLPRQPLKFLLADDPGAGKTIMAGLLMRELIARGDLKRCLVCCPGSLVEQWQEEMRSKFHLLFQPVSRDLIEKDRSGNPFQTYDLVIGRLDLMSRSEDVMAKLAQVEDWDLVVVDEAHKMSCPWYGGEAKPTKRFELGLLLAKKTRNLLLMTATPHNGKDEDFQSFLRIIDPERFEGRPRGGERVDASDLMRRMVKEKIVKFDGTPLFPERRAETPTYDLTPDEMGLYDAVTNYVSSEMNRVERLANIGQGKRGAVVGFAMTTLQRRLASSPEAIYQSLRRRRANLQRELSDIREGKKSLQGLPQDDTAVPEEEELDEEDYTDVELEDLEKKVTTHVSAAETIQELEAEITTLEELEERAQKVRSSQNHAKWNKLRDVLQNQPELFEAGGHRRKLIIFTEYRDTLNYLASRIRSLLGLPDAVVDIHGGLNRELRRYNQDKFVQDKEVLILVATDAAGEGVNLQRAHLMINYDIPWNPNRLEQRFGRIHRIGQTEVCHMWNLVAKNTREGQVWERLFQKLENERRALGDRVFDVLGRAIEAKELRDLMIQAIRYGDQPEVREKLLKVVDEKLDTKHLSNLLEDKALATDVMDWTSIVAIKEEMERAEARKLQPHFIQTFFLKAFQELGGSAYGREPKRFEITHVPAAIRQRWSEVGSGLRILGKYERITFEKDLIQVPGKPTAEYVCPGHPLLDMTIQMILEKHRLALDQGSILIDDNDFGTELRTLWYVQSDIVDERRDINGNERVVSRQVHFVEKSEKGAFRYAGYAPYLDYRPLNEKEMSLLDRDLPGTLKASAAETEALAYAMSNVLLPYYEEVRRRREDIVDKTKAAVKDRLTKEIAYWDAKANELKDQELQGKKTRLSSGNARMKADELESRLSLRMSELERERRVNMRPPFIVGCAIIVPKGVLIALGIIEPIPGPQGMNRDEIEALAMDAVITAETGLGRVPKDVHRENRGYDVESRDPDGNDLYFIEVKGRVRDATTVTVSKNEILTGLNKPDRYVLAIVSVGDGISDVRYVWEPFSREPDFDVTSVNYDLKKLLQRSREPSWVPDMEVQDDVSQETD